MLVIAHRIDANISRPVKSPQHYGCIQPRARLTSCPSEQPDSTSPVPPPRKYQKDDDSHSTIYDSLPASLTLIRKPVIDAESRKFGSLGQDAILQCRTRSVSNR